MELSHPVGAFLCVSICVAGKYFLYLCLVDTLFQIMQVSNASKKLVILGLAKCCYSISHDKFFSIL
jgi:hypothetical protein